MFIDQNLKSALRGWEERNETGLVPDTQEINSFPDYEIRDFLKALPPK